MIQFIPMQRYVVRNTPPDSVLDALASFPPLLQELLHERGISDFAGAQAFLEPSYENHIHDPFLMKDLPEAVDRILLGIEKGERIAIYGDYDCDGIPGSVLMRSLFKKIGYENVVNYIPHRHDEGYGINVGAIDTLKEDGVTLMITVDCGIVDNEPVAYAQGKGIDVIVTDHHLPQGDLPPAFAVINPKRADCSYPEPMLCGSGVAFKLAQGILKRGKFDVGEGWEKWLLDMAGLATIADMVPLTGENRAIAHFGLKVLRKSPRVGFQQLCKVARVNQRFISEDDIGFMISPRINAASRMDVPMDAFDLLSTDDEGKAGALAKHLNKLNDVRKGHVAAMSKDIQHRIHERGAPREVIVVGDPRWKPALLGLAANSVMEAYKRPVFLWGREGDGLIKGSCRSDGSINLVELMAHPAGLFIGSGGHALAGGFSIHQEHLHTLEDRLVESYLVLRQSEEDSPTFEVSRELSLDDVNRETYKIIERLAPFGEANPKPIFAFPNVEVKKADRFGKEGAHLKLGFISQWGNPVEAIAFFAKTGQFSKDPAVGDKVTLVGSIEKSQFGKPGIRVRITELL
jgi:single-stranded-DNA-specific exonuclease